MVAMVSGNSLGLNLGSLATLGQRGLIGTSGQGRDTEQAYVNIATGNLLLQDRDELVVGSGLNTVALRTYNSQGKLNDDNGDNWTLSLYKSAQLNGGANRANSRITRTDGDGSEALYTFDAARALYVNTDGGGAYDTFTVDSASRQLVWTDGDSGVSERYAGNGQGALLSMSDKSGNTLTYTYANNGILSKVVNTRSDALGEATFFDYANKDLRQIRTVVIDRDGTTLKTLTRVRYGYTNNHRLSSVTVDLSPDDNRVADGRSYTTNYTYDNQNNLTSIAQSDGTSLSFTYVKVRSNWLVASSSDGLGQTTRYSYGTGRTTVTDPLGLITLFDYDASGQLTQITTPAVNGVSATQQFVYNANGDVTRTIDGEGHSIDFSYDTNGNQTLQRDSAGNTITRTYNTQNQRVSETSYLVPDPDGSGNAQPSAPLTTRYVYDDAGKNRLRFVISAEGRVTEYRHNSFGQQTNRITYSGTFYSLIGLTTPNAASTSVTDVPTEATMNTWVAASTTDKTQSQRSDMTYDFRGQLSTLIVYANTNIDGSGNSAAAASTSYFYDPAGRLIETISASIQTGDSTSTTALTLYVYDGLDRLISSIDGLGNTTSTTYDDANNKTTLSQANGLKTISNYDHAGRLISVQQTDSAAALNLGTTHYFYDADGRLRMVQDPTGVGSWLIYDAASRVVGQIDGNGSLTEMVYNLNNQVTQTIAYATVANMSGLTLDTSGNPTSNALALTLANLRPTASANDQKSWNFYDAANRLVKQVDAAGAVTETQYDGDSRIVSIVGYANPINTTLITNSTTAGQIAPNADPTQDRIVRNFYDGDGLLRAMLDGEGSLVEMGYDAAGQETQRIHYATATATNLRATGTLESLRPGVNSGDSISTTLHDDRGQAIGQIDGENYLTENSFDANGNLIQSTRYANQVSASFTSSSTLDSLRPTLDNNSQDQTQTWRYDALNRVVLQTSVAGTQTSFTYDNVGNLSASTKALNTSDARTQTRGYDLKGRLIAALNGVGSAALAALGNNPTSAQIDPVWAQYATLYTYDAASRQTSMIDPNGNKTLYYYNADDQLVTIIDALGEVTQNTYNTLNQLIASTQYATRLSASALSGLSGGLVTNNLQSTIATLVNNSLDSTTGATYNTTGTVASSTDALGNTSNYVYNAFGEQTRITTPISSVSSLLETIAYDRRGLLTATASDTAGVNATTSTRYDAFGRAIQTTDANTNISRQSYDRLGRVVTTSDALNYTRSNSYDAFDRVASQTDALNNTTTYSYVTGTSATNPSITITTPEGVSVTTTYNRHGQTQSVHDGNGNITSYSYDANGNLLTTILPTVDNQQRQINNRYDVGDRLIETSDANGIKTTLSYDAVDRVLRRTVDPSVSASGNTPAYTGLNLVTQYVYDAKGQQIQTIDPNGVVTQINYDVKGQVTSQVIDAGSGKLNLTTSYSYDARGKTLSVSDANGVVTQYVYDQLGRRIEEHVDQPLTGTGLNLTTTYSYDKNDNVIAKTDANNNVTRYVYDANDQLVYTIDPLGDVQEMRYDQEGQITQITRYAQAISLTALGNAPSLTDVQSALTARTAATSAPDQINKNVYDKDGRVVYSIDGVGAVSKNGYDANGNVIERMAYAKTIATSTEATLSALDSAVANIADATHDLHIRNVYDAANRLVYSVDGLGAVTKNSYDKNDNLIQQIVYATAIAAGTNPNSVASNANDRSTSYFYDAANRLSYSLDGVGAVTKNIYDKNGNLTQQIAYATPLASTADLSNVATSSDDRSTRTVFDAANRQRFIIDAQGAVSETQYDKVGNTTRVIGYAQGLTLSSLPAILSVNTLQTLVHSDPIKDRIETQVFDAAHRLVYHIDALGYLKQLDYDDLGQVTSSVRYANRLTLNITPSSVAPNLTEVSNGLSANTANDQRVSYTYDAAGRTLGSTDALGFTENYTYDAVGQKTSFSDKNGGIWKYGYDAAGRLIEQRAPAVSVTTVDQDVNGKLVVQTVNNAVESVTQLRYDALGNLIERIEAFGHPKARTTSYSYDTAGRLVRTTYPTVNVYDPSADHLLTNGINSIATRSESQQTLFEQNTYNAFGEVVAQSDVAGQMHYSLYDAAGQVRYSIDALGYVTEQTYNVFGENTQLTRYASQPGLNTLSVTSVGTLDLQAVATALTVPHSADRIISTTYNRLGQKVEVTEPQTKRFYGTQNFTAGKTTRFNYDAFGNVVAQQELLNLLTGHSAIDTNVSGTWATNYFYYNQRGEQIASVDALGHLTTQGFDANGNLTEQKEFADAATNITLADYSAPITNSLNDRSTRYDYDRNNRKLSETRVNVKYSTASDATTTLRGNLTTTYTYDALGNQTQITDARGVSSNVYYDALSHIRAVVANDPGNSTIPASGSDRAVTEFQRDIYGNAVVQIEHARALTSAQLTNYQGSGASSDLADHITYTLYDSHGRAIQTTDANGNSQYTAYNARGQIAKQWQGVTGLDGITRTQYQVNEYDALGQLTHTLTPASNTRLQPVARDIVRPNVAISYSVEDFDPFHIEEIKAIISLSASNLIDLSSGDVKVEFLYRTKAFGSDSLLSQYQEHSQTLARPAPQNDITCSLTLSIFVEIYDVTALKIWQKEPSTDEWVVKWQDGVQLTSPKVQLISQELAGIVDTQVRYNAFGEVTQKGIVGINSQVMHNEVALGSGWSEYFDYDNAGHLWRSNRGDGVDKVYLYDLQGNVTADIRSRSQDLSTITNAEAATTISDSTRTDYLYDALGHLLTTQTQAARTNAQRPVINQTFDRWGNVLSVSDARDVPDASKKNTDGYDANGNHLTWLTTYRYNANNQVISETKPTETLWVDTQSALQSIAPETEFYYDATGNQIATKDARGNVNGQTYAAAGNVLREIHADGGLVQHQYDAFGNETKRIDAMNNAMLYEYDKLGNMTKIKRPAAQSYHIKPSSLDPVPNPQLIAPVALYSENDSAGDATYFGAGEYDHLEPLAFNSLTVIQIPDANDQDNERYEWQLTLYDDDNGTTNPIDNKTISHNWGNVNYDLESDIYKLQVQRVRIIKNPDGSETGFVAPQAEAQDLGSLITQVTMTYDQAGHKLTNTDGTGTTQYTYDVRGNITKMVQPGGVETVDAYDQRDRKIAETNANQDSSSWQYNYFGQATSRTDLSGKTYSYDDYDRLKHLIHQTGGHGQDMSYAYDQAGQLIQIDQKISASQSQSTHYDYDLAGRRVYEQTAQNDGKANTVIQENVLTYDKLGQLKELKTLTADGLSSVGSLSFEYDVAGNRVTQTNWYGTKLNYAYDGMNRQILVDGVKNHDATDVDNLIITTGHILTYDKNGNRTSDTYSPVTGRIKETYTYDALNRLTQTDKEVKKDGKVMSNTLIHSVKYDSADRVIQAFDNATPNSTDAQHYTNVYNTQGRLERQYFRSSTSGEIGTDRVSIFNLYDKVGNLIQSVRQLFDQGSFFVTNDYQYAKFDASYKQTLITATRRDNAGRPGTTTLSYDVNGYLVKVDGAIASDNGDHIASANNNDRTYINDVNGQFLQKTQRGNTQQDNKLDNIVANGQVFATVGIGSDQNQPLVTSKVAVKITVDVIDQDDGATPSSEVQLTFEVLGTNGAYRHEQSFENVVGEAPDEGYQNQLTHIFGGVTWPPTSGNLIIKVSGEEDDDPLPNDPIPTGTYTVSTSDWIQEGQQFVSGVFRNGDLTYRLLININSDYLDPSYTDHVEDFNSTYQKIDIAHPTSGPGSYRVSPSDSLQSIAQGAYGDAQLWYLIADANGLGSNSDLHVGQMLKLPNTVGTIHNNGSAFNPYDPARMVGDTSPYVPAPPAGDTCTATTALIIILAVVAAVVITIASAGAASAAGAAIIAGGIGITAGSAAATAVTATAIVLGGAAGGALGSAASQGILMAGGLQQDFSWNEVGIGAVVGALTAGLSAGAGVQSIAKGASLATKLLTIGRNAAVAASIGAISNAAGQGLRIIAGLQGPNGGDYQFSWREVVSAAVTSGVGGASSFRNIKTNLAIDLVAGTAAAAAVNPLVNEGRFDVQQFLSDAASNAVQAGAAYGRAKYGEYLERQQIRRNFQELPFANVDEIPYGDLASTRQNRLAFKELPFARSDEIPYGNGVNTAQPRKNGLIQGDTLNFMSQNDPFAINAAQRNKMSGVVDVIAHSNGQSLAVDFGNGMRGQLKLKLTASLIRNSGVAEDAQTILLLACDTGGERGLASDLAKSLGKTVEAPTDVLRNVPSGKMGFVGKGSFRSFSPEGEVFAGRTPNELRGLTAQELEGATSAMYRSNGAGNTINVTATEEATPDFLYRGDTRRPQGIFQNGFVPQNLRNPVELENHVLNPALTGDNWISTSTSEDKANSFAQLSATNRRQEFGYVYKIRLRNINHYKDVNQYFINKFKEKNPHADELEFATEQTIRPQDIVGAKKIPSDTTEFVRLSLQGNLEWSQNPQYLNQEINEFL